MNNLKKCLIGVLFSTLCFLFSGQGQHVDQGAIELDDVANLFKWSDLIVVATEEKFKRSVTVEKIILNKNADRDSECAIVVDLSREYAHIQPVLMGGYRYLLFLTAIDGKTKSIEDKNKIICKIAGGGNGVIALFNLDDLEDHPRVLRRKRIMPKYDFIQDLKNELYKNFGTSDGLKIKEAVERVVALYAEEDPKSQAMQLIESLRDGNPAMIRLSRELLQSIELEAID